MQLVDTHCHIHEAQFELASDNPTRARWLRSKQLDPNTMIRSATEAGVTKLVCVGTTPEDSRLAIKFAAGRDNCFVSVGVHPHEAAQYIHNQEAKKQFTQMILAPSVVALGETGLDYYYNHSAKADQITILRWQLKLAKEHNLPVIFHVRAAFDDFWPIFDEFAPLAGILHSFTGSQAILDQAINRGLYIGLNGIMTFTKEVKQLEMARAVPLTKLLLETDAPFLTPHPYRGTINEPKHVRTVAEFLANLRNEPLEQLAAATTHNARELLNLI